MRSFTPKNGVPSHHRVLIVNLHNELDVLGAEENPLNIDDVRLRLRRLFVASLEDTSTFRLGSPLSLRR